MRKIVAISLAVLTLTFSFKLNIALHYCGGKLVQSKFLFGFYKASCGMEENKNQCKNQTTSSTNDLKCCKTQIEQLITDDYQYKDAQFFSVFTPVISQFTHNYDGQESEAENYISYRPPTAITSVSLPFIKIFLI